MRVIEGKLDAAGMRFGIVASRFNGFITERLLDGAVSALRRHGADTDENVDVAWVPGAFEISFLRPQDGQERQIRRAHLCRRRHSRRDAPLRLYLRRKPRAALAMP